MGIKNKALIMDLDDTLYAELDYLISAYKYIALKLEGNVSFSNALYKKMFSLFENRQNVFEFLLRKYKLLSKEQLLYWYRFHYPEILLFDGVLECLKSLENEYKFAIVTDGRSITQRNKIKSLGIELFLDEIVISEEVGTEKPHVNNFSFIEKTLQCESYVYIGDNLKKDFITPNYLGWDTICLLDQGNNIHKQDFLIYEIGSSFLPKKIVSSWYNILDQINLR